MSNMKEFSSDKSPDFLSFVDSFTLKTPQISTADAAIRGLKRGRLKDLVDLVDLVQALKQQEPLKALLVNGSAR